jgi:hypothetical protein
MVEITEAARRELDEYFADKEKAPIRIYLSAGGCSGPRLALALDEAGETDDLFEAGGYQFIVDKDLAVQARPCAWTCPTWGFHPVESATGRRMRMFRGSCSSGSCGTSGSCCS